MPSPQETDFEYLLINSAVNDLQLTEAFVRTYYGYAHSLVNLFFEPPHDHRGLMLEIFSQTVRRLDKYLLGTNFKLWFTREVVKVCRKRSGVRSRTHIPWTPSNDRSNSDAPDSSPAKPGKSAGLHLRPRLYNQFLTLACAGPLEFTLPELAEYFKCSEDKILGRLETSGCALLTQINPDWTTIERSTLGSLEHKQARQSAHLDEISHPAGYSTNQKHLTTCLSCSSYMDFVRTLNLELKQLAGTSVSLEGAAFDQFIMAMRNNVQKKSRHWRARLPYMEIVWIVLAVGLVLSVGWIFNQLNPLVEVQSAIQSLETPVPIAIVDNPPAQVLNTGLGSSAEAVQIEPESSWDPRISLDGSRVVFASSIRRLVNEDTNEVNDIFVYNFDDKQITRISVDSAGRQANNASYEPGISANGRYIVFTSWADNLVADDTLSCDFFNTVSSCPDIFLHDLVTSETRLVSKTPEGKPGNDFSMSPEISADGRTIVFWSGASDLVPDDQRACTEENCLDIFIYSPAENQMERISIGRPFRQEAFGNFELTLSGNGRWILFTLEKDDNLAQELGISHPFDVYLYDRETDRYEAVNLTADGSPGDGSSYSASISDDGRWIVFSSRASNLVPADTNDRIDIFIRDRQVGLVERISSSFDGGETDAHSGTIGDPENEWWFGDSLRISGDGNWVIFASKASNILRNQQDYYCGFYPDCTSNLFLLERSSKQIVQINTSNVDFIPFASISNDGQYSAFMAHSINCNPSDFCTDIFVFNRESGVVAQLGSYGILTGKEIPVNSAPLENKRTLHLHQHWTTSVAISPRGDLLAAGARDGTVSLWSLPLEERLDTVEGQEVAFSPDGAILAAGTDDGQIYLWRMPLGQLAGVLSNKQRARGLAFSPDGSILAVGSSLHVRLWNLETGTVQQEFNFPGTVILDVAFSPDGDYIAAATDDHTTWITSLSLPGYSLRLGGHTDKVNAVDFSPNGLMLATSGNDNRANLWDLDKTPDGRLTAIRRTTFVHEDWVSSLAFSPDNRQLVTGSFDNTVAIWDVQRGELIDLPFNQNQNQVLSVAWGPDGTTLAAGTVRGEVHFWKDIHFDE